MVDNNLAITGPNPFFGEGIVEETKFIAPSYLSLIVSYLFIALLRRLRTGQTLGAIRESPQEFALTVLTLIRSAIT